MRFTAALCLLLSLPCATIVRAAESPDTSNASTGPATPATAPADDTGNGNGNGNGNGETIYLVTRIKLTGTDLTQVVFFRHADITTMASCEQERNAGLTTGWNHFSRYYLKTLKGISYNVEYLCVQSELRLSSWQRGVPMDHYYLVHTSDKKLKVESYRNFFACRDALKATTREESMNAFCSISSQAVLTAQAAP